MRDSNAPFSRRAVLLSAATSTVGVAAIGVTAAAAQTSAAPSLQANKAVIRQLHEGVQRDGDFALFDRLFATDYVDRTPFGDFEPNREGTRKIYQMFRAGFANWHADIHHLVAEGDLMTTHKTYLGVHQGAFMGVAPTGRDVRLNSIDIMRIRNGQIVEHWGIADGAGLMQQLRA